MPEVIIVGTGPAGISAALYTTRAGIKTTIIGKDGGSLAKADMIENYYGFREPISASELTDNGIAQAKRLGAEIITDEVVGMSYTDKLTVRLSDRELKADSIILATGAPRKSVKIPGLGDFEGRGVSYCAVCDAFFHKGKDVAVLGCCDYAISEAEELKHVAASVTIITNGAQPSPKILPEIHVITKEIEKLAGKDTLESVVFKDGTSLSVSGVFVAVGVAGSSDLARKLGANTNGNRILVDEHMATNVPGLFAAGDCTGGMLQIAKAVYEGAKAGTEAIKYMRLQQNTVGAAK